VSPRIAVTELAADLQRRFDRSFAEPPHPPAAESDELLALHAGGGRYALRLRQAAGLFSDRPVTPLPGPVPALLGVAGFSGTVVPVYDLGALLGAAPTANPRWLVLAIGSPAIAVAFDQLDGHVRVPMSDVVVEPDGQPGPDYLRGMVALPDGTRPIVDLPAVRAGVHALTGAAGPEHPHGNGDDDG
jgi:chemotaxis signal transduction protein